MAKQEPFKTIWEKNNLEDKEALFRMVDINQQIPPELYKAVAEILLFVYGLKNKNNKQV